ncbi:MAG TPA: Rrf2 family transcriptional regulator [Azospirillaceae bacterium]|nr:Rrf2 family transcriptional regulator [Azospirillaceae bacterium]
MRLTVQTDYSLRVLLYLGLRPDRLCSIREIAGAYGISENHLMKVVHRLGLFGFVRTVRGRNGGLALARPAADLGVGEVVRRTEEDMVLVECFSPDGKCPISGACTLQGVLDEALAAFLAVLDRYTLADLMGPAAAMAARLGVPLPDAPAAPAVAEPALT